MAARPAAGPDLFWLGAGAVLGLASAAAVARAFAPHRVPWFVKAAGLIF